MISSVTTTQDHFALMEQLCPFKPARGPKQVFPAFDSSHRNFVDEGMQIEFNHAIQTRDGADLAADIYLPIGLSEGSKLPVVLAITPYGKQNAFDASKIPPSRNFDPGFDGVVFSKYTPFEASDPAFWTKQGFAYVIVDARGSYASGGARLTFVSKLDGLDAYDIIEYLGTRPWTNGHVGMIGSSALGAIQWQAASLRPPHLAAIMVQDGYTDLYRELAYKGGVPHKNFMELLTTSYMAHGNNERSPVIDLGEACERYPFFNEFWEMHSSDTKSITCAVYVISSLADNGIHTPGSIRGYLTVRSGLKFLELHQYRKWEWQLTAESLERQAAFFNHVLIGPDRHSAGSVNFWPPVRLHIAEKHYAGSWRREKEFPIARTIRTRYYLGLENQLSKASSMMENASVTYDAKTRSVFWKTRFNSPTEITGTSRLHITLSISSGSDADIFVTLQKLDRDGNTVHFPYHTFINDGHVAWGWLRASKRKLDEHPVGDEVAHTFLEEDVQPLQPGQKIEVDIGIQPSATLFRAGEALKLVVQGRDFGNYDPASEIPRAGSGCNEGQHKIFLEGSYLELPVIPPMFR
ncbi:uncharacterized protein FTOL_13239 [Fusarium torulosum]|uniref:Xaa-Pro dipeptidyl-peptidase C-terminal domain-containing protein n=1 Tax=Fusarium torulosum TaxID=33205 RepID=A0AAE8MNY5_9HYPO|nr:uncharacterized protein FTOL_13239 [Fusarium torulosum]